MITAAKFRDFDLDATNGISVNSIEEKNAPERAIALAQPARSRGVTVLSLSEKAKIISVRGTIKSDTNISTYQEYVRDFIAALMEEGNLQLVSTDGIYYYEDCILLNPTSIIPVEEHYNIDYVPFNLQFLAPNGIALSATLTEAAFSNISSSPYSSTLSLLGTIAPEPIITLTLDSTGGVQLANIVFINKENNESISIATQYQGSDIVVVDTKEKSVMYNARRKRFSGIFPNFFLNDNRFKIMVETSTSIHASELGSDNTRSVYAGNFVDQKITPSANITVPQVDLLIKQIIGVIESLELYDLCNTDVIPTALWDVSGEDVHGNTSNPSGSLTAYTVGELGGGGATGNAVLTTDDVSSQGWKMGYVFYHEGTTNEDNALIQLKTEDNSKIISLVCRYNRSGEDNQYFLRMETTGFGGAAVAEYQTSTSSTFEVIQDGADIKVYFDGELKSTISGYTLGDMKLRAQVPNGNHFRITVDDVYKHLLTSQNANSDVTVELQTDNAGKASGTAVASGSVTIAKASIPTSGYVVYPFTFPDVALSISTVYHILVKQSGGDGNNYYSVKVNSAGTYVSGNVLTSSDGGLTWTPRTDEDMYFKLYTSLPSGFNLDVSIGYRKSHYSVA